MLDDLRTKEEDEMKMWKLRRTLRVKVEIAAWRWFGIEL